MVVHLSIWHFKGNPMIQTKLSHISMLCVSDYEHVKDKYNSIPKGKNILIEFAKLCVDSASN